MIEYSAVFDLLNDNQGVVDVLIFVFSVIIAWASGLFAAITRKPKLKLDVIDGPTFYSLVDTGRISEGRNVHKIALSIYLKISNVGYAPVSIEKFNVGFKWNGFVGGISYYLAKIRYVFVEVVSLSDFFVKITADDKFKYYKFFTQKSSVTGESANGYLQVGQSEIGVVYFETGDCWGSFKPKLIDNHSIFYMKLKDVYGRYHFKKIKVQLVTLDYARKFNPEFGNSLESSVGLE